MLGSGAQQKHPVELGLRALRPPFRLGFLWVCDGLQCDQGWYGIDCSIPTASQALKDIPAEEGAGKGEAALLGGAMLPAWLQGSSHGECRHAESEGDRPAMALQGHSTVLRAKLRRKPLVYIYDMPPEFTVQQLQVPLFVPSKQQDQRLKRHIALVNSKDHREQRELPKAICRWPPCGCHRVASRPQHNNPWISRGLQERHRCCYACSYCLHTVCFTH